MSSACVKRTTVQLTIVKAAGEACISDVGLHRIPQTPHQGRLKWLPTNRTTQHGRSISRGKGKTTRGHKNKEKDHCLRHHSWLNWRKQLGFPSAVLRPSTSPVTTTRLSQTYSNKARPSSIYQGSQVVERTWTPRILWPSEGKRENKYT